MNETPLEVKAIQEEEAPPTLAQGEINIFCKTPDGYDAHIKISLLNRAKAATYLAQISAALSENGFAPSSRFPGKLPAPQDGPAPFEPARSNGAATWILNRDGSRSCSLHGIGKFVPPGTSKRTGKPYQGFWACETQGCKPTEDEP